MPYDKLNIKLFINDIETKFTTEYQFEEKGEYIIEFKFNEELTNLSSLFMNINNLKEIDLSGLNTNKVISMDKLFFECSSLEIAHLNNLDTQNVKSMISMFKGCIELKDLYLF
jgi:surface protein